MELLKSSQKEEKKFGTDKEKLRQTGHHRTVRCVPNISSVHQTGQLAQTGHSRENIGAHWLKITGQSGVHQTCPVRQAANGFALRQRSTAISVGHVSTTTVGRVTGHPVPTQKGRRPIKRFDGRCTGAFWWATKQSSAPGDRRHTGSSKWRRNGS